MRLSYFFSKKECILAILEVLIFKIFRPVRPNHGGASLVTEPQPPQSQKCGYAPVVQVRFQSLSEWFIGFKPYDTHYQHFC